MAIDKELIETTMIKLSNKLEKVKEESRELNKLISTLHLIRAEKPIDPITDEVMSADRVKEVFNSIAKKASKYTSGNK